MANQLDILAIVRKAVEAYAKPPINGDSFLSISEDGLNLSVIDIYWDSDQRRYADAGLIVRVINEQIVIERDMNDKPLVDALVQADIPRSQIILAYAGEPVPEAMSPGAA
jgi:hypothetical protein